MAQAAPQGGRAAGGRAAGGRAAGGEDSMERLANMLAHLVEERPAPREQFKAPIYDGSTDVELFVAQFRDVQAANNWPDAVALLKLRSALTGSATECGRGGDLGTCMTALRARFGLTTRQARDRLGGLRKDNRKSFYEHGVEVERLVRIAYPDLQAPTRLDMALDVFSRSLDNRSLQRHMLAVAPADIDSAVRVAEEYLQIGSSKDLHNVRGVDQDDESSIRVTLNKILQQLEENSKAIEKNSQIAAENSRAIADLRNQSSKRNPTGSKKKMTCYGCGGDHMIRDCPNKAKTNLVQQEDQGNEESSC